MRENSKDQAERKLYENLRDQIDALTEQINQLTLRSDVQEEAIRKINYKRRESQKIASEAYFELVMFCTAQQCPPCPRLESIKAKLNQIIDN